MAVTPSTTPPLPNPHRKRFTRSEYRFLYDNGLLGERRVELIDGDIVEQMPKNQPHTIANDSGYELLTDIFGRGFVRHSAPIIIDDESEPEPDLAVTRQDRRADSSVGNPVSSEVLLSVEISDSTLRYDLSTKAELYSRAGIQEYWVVDISARTLVVHRDPTPTGYLTTIILDEAQTVAPLAAPQATLRISDFLP